MAFCPNCGSSIDAGATSCVKCGGQAGASSPPPSVPVYVTAPSPHSFQPGGFPPAYGMPLPDPSPMAIIMAAGSWVICGPLLSVPAVIKARSDMAGVREGRYNPNSMGMCQIAFWIGLVNAGLWLAALLFIGVLFVFGFFVAATAKPHHRPTFTTSPTPTSSGVRSGAVRTYEAIESDVERLVAARPESERKLWRQTRDDLRTMRRQKGAGPLPEAKGLTELLRIAEADPKLRSALTELERKAAQESGREAPAREMPAEAPGQGPPPEDGD